MEIANVQSVKQIREQGRPSLPFHTPKKKKKRDDFKQVLDAYLAEAAEDFDVEEYRLSLPRHGHFWDNGYEDVG